MSTFVNAAAALFLVSVFILAAGCTGSNSGGSDTAQGSLRAHYDYQESWGPTYGCYSKVSGYAYNAGSAPVDNVQLDFNLVNSKTGSIRDSKQVSFGTLDAGQSRTFDVVLDGECTEDYRVEAIFGK